MRARQERRRIVSIWESSRSGSMAKQSLTFSTLCRRKASQKAAGPTGQPRREKPPLMRGIFYRRGLGVEVELGGT